MSLRRVRRFDICIAVGSSGSAIVFIADMNPRYFSARRAQERSAWKELGLDVEQEKARFKRDILPRLQDVTLSRHNEGNRVLLTLRLTCAARVVHSASCAFPGA